MDDKAADLGYNNKQYVNEPWEGEIAGQHITGEVVERLDKSKFVKLTNSECKHLNTTRDEDETDVYYAIKCADCPIGWLVKKS